MHFLAYRILLIARAAASPLAYSGGTAGRWLVLTSLFLPASRLDSVGSDTPPRVE